VNTGFMLLRSPSAVDSGWSATQAASDSNSGIRSIRAAFPECDASRYRGIQRAAFCEDHDGPKYSDANALLVSVLGPTVPGSHVPRSLIPTLDLGRELLSRLPDASTWELVCVSSTEHRSGPFLGYDVGYWGGGDFSILADAVVMPRWHPPPPRAFPGLRGVLGRLNPNVLFASRSDAVAYRAYYMEQPWAEVDAGDEFVVQCLSAVENRTYAA